MSDVNVILATNRLQIAHDGDDILLDSVTYINITSVNPLVYVHKSLDGSVPGIPVPYTAATVTTEDTNWAVELHMADGRTEVIKLIDVQNQPGWTNDQLGYEQAEIDIYANFPGVSGGGPVASVTASAPLNSSGGANPNISHLNSGVVAGSYTNANITVDAKGHITLASDGTGGGSVLAGNTLYVDDVNGDDGTGTRGVFNLPYATIDAAVADASSGDCIVIRPGTYSGVNDLITSPVVLNFFLEPGATGVDVTVDTITAVWRFYGAPVGDVTIAATGAYCLFSGGVDGTLSVGAFDTADVYDKITGVTTCYTGNINLYSASCSTVVLENNGTIVLTASVIGDVSSATAGSVQGVAGSAITGTITGAVQVNGDTFYGTLTPPSTGDIPVANADGSWSWSNALAGKADGGYLTWVGLIYWNGSAATATVFQNTLGGTLALSDAGGIIPGSAITLSLTGAFPAGKTWCVTGGGQFDTNDDIRASVAVRGDADSITVFTYLTDQPLAGCPVEIRVYP